MPNHPDVDEALGAIGERDHSVTGEYRIFGPPGTGKTTNLTRQIRRAVDRFGKDSVLVTSFSRAAAAELAGRDLPLSSIVLAHYTRTAGTHWVVLKLLKFMSMNGIGRIPTCGLLPQRRNGNSRERIPRRSRSAMCGAAITG